MTREEFDLTKKAIEENWDVYKIMAEFTSFQKEKDAKTCESNGQYELAELIRNQ